MVNVLLCGNKKVFDGALTQLISMTNRTKETINCYIFTMDLTRLSEEYVSITDEQIDFLNEVVKSKNMENKVTKVDVTKIYEQEFAGSANESAYCTPYTLLRLFADKISIIPDKILYLDIDIMIGGDITKLYNINIDQYEYAAVKEKYGCWLIRPDYINAGMLLLNMKKIKETGLLEKAYNEQSRFNNKKTIICHFCKRLLLFPYPHTENFKQWHIEEVHKVLKCNYFDNDLNEYLEWKKKYNSKERIKNNEQ